ncbi:translation initiation factor IF-2 subunit gamma [Candidatus Woesearchaeota archaeon]|nr:translation initiation factor IF-2 subunit gamma [Candidatus Woesearchaeota archaeon]
MPRKKKEVEEKVSEEALSEEHTKKKKTKEAKKSEKKEEKSKKTEKKDTLGQPEINIGLVGHVDHGKTTLVKALSGKWTDTHSEEMKRGITIRLGYADAIFYHCEKCDEYSVASKCITCMGHATPLRKVSFVDAPGHESLMATMLSGATIMDGAILMISAIESCPQPQTKEHVQALQIIGIKNVVIVQNKIDLVTEEKAKQHYQEIKAFLESTEYKDAPIIPMSAQHGINVTYLIEAIQRVMPTPQRDATKDPVLFVARSFDINKPGSPIDNFVGGVLGGSLQQGTLQEGDEIEILPGYSVEEKNQKVHKPLKTKIISLMTGGEKVKVIVPGGSVALLTGLDPSIVKSDRLTGALVGKPGKLPPVWYEIKLEVHLLERMVGLKDALVIDPLRMNEILMLNVNSAATVGFIVKLQKNIAELKLKLPVCAAAGSRMTLSRRVGNRWRLIGYGTIKG